jgi:hypothetical protein
VPALVRAYAQRDRAPLIVTGDGSGRRAAGPVVKASLVVGRPPGQSPIAHAANSGLDAPRGPTIRRERGR